MSAAFVEQFCYVSSMRGHDEEQGDVFSYIPLEQRIPRDHPLRRIRQLVDVGLKEMGAHFEALYARRGRPSIPPRAAAARAAVAGAVRHPQRDAVDGAA